MRVGVDVRGHAPGYQGMGNHSCGAFIRNYQQEYKIVFEFVGSWSTSYIFLLIWIETQEEICRVTYFNVASYLRVRSQCHSPLLYSRARRIKVNLVKRIFWRSTVSPIGAGRRRAASFNRLELPIPHHSSSNPCQLWPRTTYKLSRKSCQTQPKKADQKWSSFQSKSAHPLA